MKDQELNICMFLYGLAIINLFACIVVPIWIVSLLTFFMSIVFATASLIYTLLLFRPKRSLTKDKRGAVWLWAVAGLTLAAGAFLWWALTWPLARFITKIESIFTFPSEAVGAINLFKTIVIWFLVLLALGTLFWVIVNSQRRGQYPY